MATVVLTRGKTLPDTGTKTDLHDLIDQTTGAVSGIVNADISNSAAIAGSKINPAFGSQDATCKDLTASGEVDAATLDISGNADIDGTLETDAITLNGVAVNEANGLLQLDSSGDIAVGMIPSTVIKGIGDYGTSGTTGSAKTLNNLLVYYGYRTVATESSATITNLGFTSKDTYSVSLTLESDSTSQYKNANAVKNSGSQFTIYNASNTEDKVHWIAIGT
jgi:hypothetical protein